VLSMGDQSAYEESMDEWTNPKKTPNKQPEKGPTETSK
jgi:hypothetical protein